MNLTVTQPTAGGFLTAYASGGTVPGRRVANFTAGTTLANLSLVPVGADGAIALRTTVAGTVHVIADVQGYVVGGTPTAAGAVVPVPPTRVFDSRNSIGSPRTPASTSSWPGSQVCHGRHRGRGQPDGDGAGSTRVPDGVAAGWPGRRRRT